MTGRFEGKTAVVTGGTAGIGEAIVRRLHAEGAHVVIVARSTERCEQLVDELGEHRAAYVAGSVAHWAVAERAVQVTRARGGAAVLVNNAGIDLTSDLLATDESEVRRIFETNFFGACWMLMRFGAELKDRGGGAIVNVTSRLAEVGVPSMTVYGASKGALLSLTRGAAIDLAPYGVRVNAVAPGMTATPLFDAWLAEQPDPERTRAEVARAIPQGRVGLVDDVAAAVSFLAADEAAHITGVSLPVDGGYTAA